MLWNSFARETWFLVYEHPANENTDFGRETWQNLTIRVGELTGVMYPKTSPVKRLRVVLEK